MKSPALLLPLALIALACSGPEADEKSPAVDLGFAAEGPQAEIVVDGLMNPSGVTFDAKGRLTVCDSGHGRVLVVENGKPKDWLTGFDTEYWKIDAKTGDERFKLGPLNAIWMPNGQLVVSDSGKKDGEDRLGVFDGSGAADQGKYTNGVASTTGAEGDLGEGNPTGFALGKGGVVWACGQGTDAKTWILRCDVDRRTLEPWASSDDEGIAINSPMQILAEDDQHLLVLYSGAGGKDDGLIARWNIASRKPVKTWTLPGLTDPMGMAFFPGSKALAVVDNNWALTEVKSGRLARVTLGDGEAADVKVLATKLRGPVACCFGPDERLYVAQLGAKFDSTEGSVIAISGL
ncbi:MAG: hypothetical protein R3F20_18000 [Planctomycetota bacterium]